MSRKIILVGDATDHGGTVISGDPLRKHMGRAIARLGDAVSCPQPYPGGAPHGVNKIIEGDATYKIGGVPVALEGHHTECGCSLIGSIGRSVG